MKNKRTTRIAAVMAAIAITGFALAACDHGGGNNTPPDHVHTAAAGAEWQKDATGHWKDCKDNDGGKVDFASHAPADSVCDACGWDGTPPPNPNAGKTWTAVDDSTFGTSAVWAVARGNNKFVAGGGTSGTSPMAYSSDGITWTAVDDSTFGTSMVRDLAWGGNKFVAAGYAGKMAYSADGITWTAVESSTFGTSNIMAVARGGDKFVAAASDGKMAYSADGITWTAVEESTFGSDIVRALAWDGNTWVAGGANGKIAYSK